MSDSGKILLITDKFGVSQGYEPAFTRMLQRCGLNRSNVTCASIYNLVKDPCKKYGNEVTWKFDVEKKDAIMQAFDSRVNIIKPKLIVIADPACVGIFAKWDLKIATLDKMRGGVYEYRGIPVIITYPITAIHQKLDTRLVTNEDGEEDRQEPYRVQQGSWILSNDWAKIGRFFNGKRREVQPFTYSITRTREDCMAAERFLLDCVLIASDHETGCWPAQITCTGFTGLHRSGVIRTFVFPFYDAYKTGGVYWDSQDDHEFALMCVRHINESPIVKTFHNGSYDQSYNIRDRIPADMWLLDSMQLWYAKHAELPKKLDFVTSILMDNYQYWKADIKGVEPDGAVIQDMERYWRYNGLDCYYTLHNTLFLLILLGKDPAMQYNYNDVFLRSLSGLKMSMRGMKADFERREMHRRDLEEERRDKLDKFRFMIDDPDFNVESPVQKVRLLYDFLGIRPRTDRGRFTTRDAKGKGKAPSSGAFALKLAKTDHPFFRGIIEAMEEAMSPAKQISNVCEIKLFTDRMRYSMNGSGTETGRFSCSSSAFWDGSTIQNIRDKYRDWMVADEGCVLFDIDYSQSDDVFMAYEAQDPEKIAVVESGKDAHAVNGELLFKRPYDWIVAGKKAHDPLVVHEITGIRQVTKKVVHGSNFQMAAFTLYITAGREAIVAAAELLGFADAESWDQDRLVHFTGGLMLVYRRKYKRFTPKEFYAEIAAMLKARGRIVNAFGLTRTFLGSHADNGTQREATAFIGQSDTASNMNRVMYEIDFGFIPKNFRDAPNPDANAKPLMMDYDSHGIRFMLQVHDNFLNQLSVRHPRWKEAAHNLLHVMNRPVIIHGREVRIRAEAGLGLRWGHTHMTDWDGKDPYDLDRIVTSLSTAKGMKAHG